MRYGIFLGLLAALLALPAGAQTAYQLYPQGGTFPLGLYALDTKTSSELLQVANAGWNLGQTYGSQSALLSRLAPSPLGSVIGLTATTEYAAAQVITGYAARRVSWWGMPEELRYWYPTEFAQLVNLAAWTRRYDAQQRPNYVYIPGHYTATNIAPYVPYADILGMGAYPEYARMPHAWVRWRLETAIAGIQQAGRTVGPSYRSGQRVPVGVCMCFTPTNGVLPTPAGAYHDAYSCLASGAQGLLIYAYCPPTGPAGLQDVARAYAKAAAEITGSEGVGKALLFGTRVPIGVTVLQGPTRTVSFTPPGVYTPVSYPALNVRAVRWGGRLYMIVVNSTETTPVTATFSNLGLTQTQIRLPFEGRTLPVRFGTITDTFAPLGVHVYVGS